MAVVSIKDLLKTGVHFGHEISRWNPKMRRYIFEARNGIHIIDLQQTLQQIEDAYNFIRETVANGKPVLFVGTKRQARDSIKEAAVNSKMFFVTERWLGGLLTNNATIRKSVGRLKELERIIDEGIIARLPKKEAASIRREKARLDRNLTGIADMDELPGALFVVDTRREKIAVAEGRKLGIPIVAIIDTNCDPDEVDFPIVSNDDAIRGIQLIVESITRACIEGSKQRPVKEEKAVRKPAGGKAVKREAEQKEVTEASEEDMKVVDSEKKDEPESAGKEEAEEIPI